MRLASLPFSALWRHIRSEGRPVISAVWPYSFLVGYAQSGLKSGATMVTPQFMNVSAEEMPLTSIVPTGDDLSDNVNIQTLNNAGYTVKSYTWNDWMYDDACWVDDDTFEAAENVSFAFGQGLWTVGSSSDQGVQSAGRVCKDDAVMQLQSGATGIGNPFPVPVALTDIIPEGDDLSDNVNIQTLNNAGYTVKSYTWNDWMYDDACWVDDDTFEAAEDVTFIAGEGLWVVGSSNTQYLRIPAPEL